jgi:hypothetical protein
MIPNNKGEHMEPVVKPFYQSKTFWVNVLACVAITVPSSATFIKEHLGETGAAWAMINMVLRFISKDKISIG